MKIRTSISLATIALCPATQGTVLTFEALSPTNADEIDQSYGDNVASFPGSPGYGSAGGVTPNVSVSYSSENTRVLLWNGGFNSLSTVIYNEGNGTNGTFTVSLQAEPGLLARLDGFDLGNFGAAVTLPFVRVEDGNGSPLFAQTNVDLPASTAAHLDFDFGTPLEAQELNIIVDVTGLGGATDNIGIANVQFGQAVPEPSSLAFLSIAGLALLARRRS